MTKEIIPAVLPENFKEIEVLIRRLDRQGGFVQIDICDGRFVTSQTWPYIKNQIPEFKDDFELPGWENFDYELDLMILNPEKHIDNLKNVGASRAVVHAKSTDQKGFLEACFKLQAYDIEVGVGLEHSSQNYSEYLKILEDQEIPFYIQVMGIDTIGKQGEPLSDNSIEFIKKLHSEYPEIIIQVDGAVSASTIQKVSEAGASRFVVGSWFSNGHIKDKIQELKNLI